MTIKELNEAVRIANALVADWPAWKRNILEDSASPTVAVPRQPVFNEAANG